MKKQNKEIIVSQMKSIIVYQFLNLFNELELLIREVFEESLNEIEKNDLNKLYFFYGGKIGSYFEYETDAIRLNEIKFKKDEKFKNLTIIQILKMNKSTNFIKKLAVQIKSIQRESTMFDVQDCIIKLINMRNILSHELVECNFKDKDIIDLLSNEKYILFDFEFLVNYDYNMMDDSSKAIMSNFIYMKEIINTIKSSKDIVVK